MHADALMPLCLMALTLVLALSAGGCDDDPANPRVVVNGHTFFVEVADDVISRTRGLSGRGHIEPETGMLFVFDRATEQTFWMKDCLVPIDIAFLDAQGRILNLATMPVEPDPSRPRTRYTSAGPSQYVLETAAGTWRRIGARPGMTVTFLDIPAAPEPATE